MPETDEQSTEIPPDDNPEGLPENPLAAPSALDDGPDVYTLEVRMNVRTGDCAVKSTAPTQSQIILLAVNAIMNAAGQLHNLELDVESAQRLMAEMERQQSIQPVTPDQAAAMGVSLDGPHRMRRGGQ